MEDFVVGIPNKNDPKYQTLPYNAKLFAPFSTKQQILSNNHSNLSQDQDKFDKAIQQMQIITLDHHHQQQQQQQQQQTGNNKMNNFTNNLQLHQLLSQNNHHNTKSANNILTESHQQPSAGLQPQQQQQQQSTHMSNGLHHLVKGKSWSAGIGESNNGFPLVRPSNFLPTGAPSPVTDLNGLFNSQVRSVY